MEQQDNNYKKGYNTVDWVVANSSIRAIPERGLSFEAVEKLGIRVAIDPTSGEIEKHYYPYYNEDGKLVAFKERTAADKKFRAIGTLKNTQLFGQNSCGVSGKLLIITEGELDAAAAIEIFKKRGKNYRVCSLVNGASINSLKQNIEWLETFENIFIAFDQDEPGQECAEKAAALFTPGKVKIMHFSEKDPNAMLLSNKEMEFFNALYNATEYKPDGIVSVEDVYEDAIKPVEWGLSWPWETLTQATYGYRRKEIYGIGGASGGGKCLAEGTLVRMFYGGIRPVEDISIGDILLGDDGGKRTVLALGSGVDQMYRVSQADGTSYTVNSEHILSVISGGKVRDIPIKTAISRKTPMYGYNAIADYPYKDTMIPPYQLGIWLGDGHVNSPSITCGDNEVIEAWRDYGISIGMRPVEYTGEQNCIRLNLSRSKGVKHNKVYDSLKILGLVKDGVGYKHIPSQYLYNSIEVRKELLAGLIDTDGTVHKDQYDFVFKDSQLSESLFYLARSLGYRARQAIKTVNSKEYYRVTIRGDFTDLPVRIVRKRIRGGSPKDRIISIEPIGKGRYYGFEIDGNKRFALANYTVTHNTEYCKELIDHIINVHHNPVGVIFLEEPVTKTLKVLAGKKFNKRFHVPDGGWTIDELKTGINDLKGKVYLYNHFGGKDWASIKSKIRYMVVSLGIKDIVLDHLTALIAQEDNEYKALNRIMEEMASLTQELDFTLFYVSHLRKPSGTPHEEGGRVSADQFKGSGAIVYWSNFLFGIERNQQADDDVDKNTTLFRILKDRNTGLGTGVTFKLWYDHSTGRWREKTDDDGLEVL